MAVAYLTVRSGTLMKGSYLQHHLTYKRVGRHNLFILPWAPAWAVLSDSEAILLRFFVDGYEGRDLFQKAISCGVSSDGIERVLSELLVKLKERGIYPLPKNLFAAPDADVYQRNVHLCLTHACNLSCRHCYIAAGKKIPGEMSFREWKVGLDRLLSILDGPEVTVTGGEPTVVPFCRDLLAFIKDRGANITLYTNGIQNIDELMPHVDRVQVSLEGISPRTNDFIRGKGSFAKTIRVINGLKERAERLTISMTLMAHNFDEIATGLEGFLSKTGLSDTNVRLNAALEESGRAPNLPPTFRSFVLEHADDVFGFVAKFIQSNPKILLKNMRNCGIGLSLGLDSNGDIYPCDMFHNCYGNILTADLPRVLEELLLLNSQTEVDRIVSCQTCDLKYICLGGCKARNRIRNGSYCLPVCDDESKLLKYYQMIYDIGV